MRRISSVLIENNYAQVKNLCGLVRILPHNIVKHAPNQAIS